MARTRACDVVGIDFEDEHEAFAASRSTDYIYEPGSDSSFAALDSHAETIEMDAKLPFVITGSPGCGKSALLANWVNRRRQLKHRDEFLFQHFVGCSPRSKRLAHLLYRLESAIKEHFQLREMEVPTSEERLRWSLNRFLAAAAKKQCPARIVIVLDAVNCLHGDCSAADTLHWLPTDLPQGVRIIVATIELEHYGALSDDIDDEGSRIHRTYTELRRRKCPTIRLQPLTVEIRHQIIGSFLKANREALHSLEQAQQFRLVTAKASSQPLFLRTILYALRLGFEMSNIPVDQQIDTCLCAETSSQLIARVLKLCSGYVDGFTRNSPARLVLADKPSIQSATMAVRPTAQVCADASAAVKETTDAVGVFPQVLTAMYTSRRGLSETEVWGIVELAHGRAVISEQRDCIRRVLRDFTFSVKGLKSFSHEDYATVVFSEYIQSPDVHIRAHQLMAKFFGKLPSCHRKLDALPYHLEVSGSWLRLRAALVDVRMFRLWWTPSHKTEFLNLWASLTASSNPSTPIRKLVTGEFDETMRFTQPLRPCLDIVEEYVRSVDDFKFLHSPSDDELALVILRIADFMLEFATLCLEEAADVPQFVHPAIPSDDLASLGVPYLSRDKDGNSVLNSPFVEATGDKSGLAGKHNGMDTLLKVNEEVPTCSTYFYHRWMWIQFPLVSLANCGERYLNGVAEQAYQDNVAGRVSTAGAPGSTAACMTRATVWEKAAMSAHLERARDSQNLPSSGCEARKKADGPVGQVTSSIHYSGSSASTRMARRSPNIYQYEYQNPAETNTVGRRTEVQIDSYRLAFDSLRHERLRMAQHLRGLHCTVADIRNVYVSTVDLESTMDGLVDTLARVNKRSRMAQLLFRNYEAVHLMCKRHPAHSEALICELEAKLSNDTHFINEVKKKLRKGTFEFQDFLWRRRSLQRAVREKAALQNGMLTQRIRQREDLTNLSQRRRRFSHTHATASKSGMPMRDNSLLDGTPPLTTECFGNREISPSSAPDESHQFLLELSSVWEEQAELIRKRTFITDVKEFFMKFVNAQTLQAQMTALHNAAEARHRELKSSLSTVESELEQVRYDSQSMIGSNSREARDLQSRLSAQQGRHKRTRETALAAERLRQDAFGGIKHVCSILGVPAPDQDTPINEIMHQVESVLEALMEERDKTVQKIGDNQPTFRESSPGYDKLMRAPELDAALEQFQTPKAMIAHNLFNKVGEESRIMQNDLENDAYARDEGESRPVMFATSTRSMAVDHVTTRGDLKIASAKIAKVHKRLSRLSL
eukprot:CAMPEP_0197391526 /NCGR_PEP_ID=MMETSP1165-20131217/3155_1 /TAXON_ID=284809 /ORGANISM="Chrysocystis fragilis, Strain CCMP3189" /LENGTH=1276 /DNA_ID=CAMNT_0042917115 /DNA_START=42 /DNA_END=3872 /DNA_ORIENTATION=-